MQFKKRKFTAFFLLCVFVLSIISFSVGCTDDGFTPVYKIEYTTNGQATSQKSYLYYNSNDIEITKEEYDTSPINKRMSTYVFSEFHTIPKEAKGKTSYTEKLVKTDTDDLIRYSERFNSLFQVYIYYKIELKSITYYYVYVKVVNSSTIIIRNHKGETTYTVTSYSITKFR